MADHKCTKDGVPGYQAGPGRTCFTGPGAREKAAAARQRLQANQQSGMETLTFNIGGKGSPVRHAAMEGREYLVAPMAMAAEGVMNGSNGPLFYPGEEFAKTPQVWNHKPIVVYHPEENGRKTSACTPDILTSRKVGVIMNTHFDGKLRAEAWLELDRVNKVDARIATALESNQIMELSTGLFTDNELKSGEFEGKPYDAIARNYRPDHLALLPDQSGAYSVSEGAGLLQTNAHTTTSFRTIQNAIEVKLEDRFSRGSFVDELFPTFVIFRKSFEDSRLWKLDYTYPGSEPTAIVDLAEAEPMEVVRTTQFETLDGEFVGNGGFFSGNIALTAAQVSDLPDSDFAIILPGGEKDDEGKTTPRTLRKLPIPDAEHVRNALARLDQTSLTQNEKVKAFRKIAKAAKDFEVTVGEKITEQFSGNQRKDTTMPANDKQKTTVIDALITNESTNWTEEDRPTLMLCEDTFLEKLNPVTNEPIKASASQPTINVAPPPKTGAGGIAQPSAPVVNDPPATATEPQTAEQWLLANKAPPEIVDMWAAGLATRTAEINGLVETITANESNTFAKEWLLERPVTELQGIAALAKQPEAATILRPSYAGAAAPHPTTNSGEKPMVLNRVKAVTDN